MSELTNPADTLWHLAWLLTKEDNLELANHYDHDCYAGALVMQELILRLYPEVPIPAQRDRNWEDFGAASL